MKQLHILMNEILNYGQRRETRSGDVLSVFRRDFEWDMRKGLPFPMSKKLAFNAVVGELLWFINGDTDLGTLREYTGLPEDAWTIWSDDCKRWNSSARRKGMDPTDLGKLYGHQWRRFGEDLANGFDGVDQLANLIYNMKNSPTSRYLIVQAYNPVDIFEEEMALPPCHTGFQVYVDIETGEFDLDWTQRSSDIFLGAPFNIASYAMLMIILSKLTGLRPRYLFGSLKDTHIYTAHIPAVREQLSREETECNAWIELPEFSKLEDLSTLTAKDFILHDYNPQSAIKAPLLVG